MEEQTAATAPGFSLPLPDLSQTGRPLSYWIARAQPRIRAIAVPVTSPALNQVQAKVLVPVFGELDQFAGLAPDWDAYGAAPIALTAIEGARALLEAVCVSYPYLDKRLKPYAVAPIADGGVQMEWRGGYRHLQVEVRQDRTLAYLLIDRSRSTPQYTEVSRTTRAKAVDLIAEVATAPYSA